MVEEELEKEVEIGEKAIKFIDEHEYVSYLWIYRRVSGKYLVYQNNLRLQFITRQ